MRHHPNAMVPRFRIQDERRNGVLEQAVPEWGTGAEPPNLQNTL